MWQLEMSRADRDTVAKAVAEAEKAAHPLERDDLVAVMKALCSPADRVEVDESQLFFALASIPAQPRAILGQAYDAAWEDFWGDDSGKDYCRRGW